MSNYVLSLDLSTKSGYAMFRDGELLFSGTAWPDKSKEDFGTYPQNYILWARYLTQNMFNFVSEAMAAAGIPNGFVSNKDLTVVIEETTASQSNYSQKILEFVHFLTVTALLERGVTIKYLRDGTWKNITGARQTKEERNFNAKVSRIKKKIKKETGKQKGILAKIDGKVVRPFNEKDYYIRQANTLFGLDLKDKDEDRAAAILLGKAYLMGAICCDGTPNGGTMTKSEDTHG